MRILVWWASNFVALLAAAWLVEGIDYDSIWWLVLAALVFGLVNLFLRPMIVLLALPGRDPDARDRCCSSSTRSCSG